MTTKGWVASSILTDFKTGIFERARSGDIMNGHDGVLLDTSPWRKESPGDHCYNSASITELGNVCFVGYIALSRGLHSQVAMQVSG